MLVQLRGSSKRKAPAAPPPATVDATKFVERPLVRSFKRKFAKEAAAHARAGGHSVLWENDKRAILFFPKPEEGNEDDFGLWAVYDFGKFRWHLHERGTFRGLGSTLVPRDCLWIVRGRVERDAVHPGATRKIYFDCQSCAACCRDNEVILLPPDVQRFKDAGRGELAKPPYAKRHKDGRLILTLLPNKHCRHLGRDKRCKIYAIRPHACSEFPMGSECCMFARSDVLNLHDGAIPSEG